MLKFFFGWMCTLIPHLMFENNKQKTKSSIQMCKFGGGPIQNCFYSWKSFIYNYRNWNWKPDQLISLKINLSWSAIATECISKRGGGHIVSSCGYWIWKRIYLLHAVYPFASLQFCVFTICGMHTASSGGFEFWNTPDWFAKLTMLRMCILRNQMSWKFAHSPTDDALYGHAFMFCWELHTWHPIFKIFYFIGFETRSFVIWGPQS